MFQPTTAVSKICQLSKPYRVIKGGTYAGKTYCIIAYLIDTAIKNDRLKVTVVAESIPAIKSGALAFFIEIMQDLNRWNQSSYHGGDRVYTFPNQSTMQFTSFDSVGKAKAAGKRDVLYLNEANHIQFDVADALATRTEWFTIFDYNPDREFWVDTEILTRNDSEHLTLTYMDNEATPEKIKNDLAVKLEKAKTSDYWKNWCEVYVFGRKGNLQGQVYQFTIVDEIPADAEYYKTGLDFGHSPDPTAAADVYIQGGNIYIDEVMYQTEMSVNDIHQKLTGRKRSIIADSSEKRTVRELYGRGINITAIKQKPTIAERIKLLNSYTLHITSRSLNAIKEGRMYIFKKDEFGRNAEPIDDWNHIWDAVAYAMSDKVSKRASLKAL